MLERKQLKNRAQVTFVLPEGTPTARSASSGTSTTGTPPPTPWSPEATAPAPRPSRFPATARTPSATSPPHDYWFDDEHADSHDGTNSRLHT